LAQVSETHDPETFAEASGHPDWDTTMNEEYHLFNGKHTWDLVPLPKGRKLVRCKWVYITKYASDGSVERHKAQLVSKGFSQVEGIDYNETFSPVAKMNSIHLVLALVPHINGRSIRWMLNLPSCMGICKNKSTWNNLLAMSRMTPALFVTLRNLFMVLRKLLELGMPKWTTFFLNSDPNVYTKKVGIHLIILVLYVDDLILTGSDPKLLNHVKTNLKKRNLRSKALYQITLGKELEPTNYEKKVKSANNSDEAYGLIEMSISPDLRFHLQGIDSMDASWTKLEAVFGKHNIIRSHQIENQ
jgi:hypothetical protein